MDISPQGREREREEEEEEEERKLVTEKIQTRQEKNVESLTQSLKSAEKTDMHT